MTRSSTRIAGAAFCGALAVAGVLSLAGCTPEPPGPAVVVLFPGSEDDDWGASAAVLRTELAADGYAVEVHFAGDDIPEQLGQLEAALSHAPAAVVIAPVDPTSIAAVLAGSDDPAVSIIAYDRLILDAPEVDYFATYDHREAGRMQAQSLVEGLSEAGATAPVSIELLAGSADDPTAVDEFAGAMEVLEPLLESRSYVVPSGRVSFEEAAILRGDPEAAAERVTELLDEGVQLDGVLSPDDAMSAAIAEAVADDEPLVLTGGGPTRAGLTAVADGTQYATVYEAPRALARTVADMVREVLEGATPTITQGATSDNGAREVPTRLLQPRLVVGR